MNKFKSSKAGINIKYVMKHWGRILKFRKWLVWHQFQWI